MERIRFEDYGKQVLYACVAELNDVFAMLSLSEISVANVANTDVLNGKIWFETTTLTTDNYGDFVARFYVTICNGEVFSYDIYELKSENDVVKAVEDGYKRTISADRNGYYNLATLGYNLYDIIVEYITSNGFVVYYTDDDIDELRTEHGEDYMPEYAGEGLYFM